MSTKRRDKKNRLLLKGESQRANGRYEYRYKDIDGVVRAAYSWRLVATDRIPEGKTDKGALRDLEKVIQERLAKHESMTSGDMTVMELVEKYLAQKTGVKNTTRMGYRTVVHWLEKDPFSKRKIDTVKMSDAKCWFIDLQKNHGRSYTAIHNIRGVLRPAFQMAVDDDLLIKNPFQFGLCTVVVNDTVTREALSWRDEQRFLEFLKNDRFFNRYYDAIYVLLNTGMRISEFVGLTMDDVDMEKRTINIDHQLHQIQVGESMLTYIDTTKTYAGKRVIPMTDDVFEAMKRIIENRKTPKVEPEIDGYSGFLILGRNGMPLVSLHWQNRVRHARKKYNSTHKDPLPNITPHIFRHTYCSKMARSGMNPKVLQYLMGHSVISVTMDTYAHVKLDDAQSELIRLKGIQNVQAESGENTKMIEA